MTEEEYKSYGQALARLKTAEEVIEKLSSIKENLLYRGIDDTSLEIEKIISFLEDEKIAAMELNLKDDASRINFIIDVCDEFLVSEKVQARTEKLTSEELSPKQIVFAKTEMGNIYFEQDLKKIKYSKEVYDGIKNIFDFIKSGQKPNNSTVSKKLTNNGKIQDIFEYKDYQTRVYARFLTDNVICIIGIRIKKDNNPKSIQTFLVQRCSKLNSTKTFEKIEEMIRNGEKEKLVSKGEEELNKIISDLNSKTSIDKKIQVKEISEVKKEASEETSISEEWMQAYNLAKIVYEKEGKIDVRITYKINGFAFGWWVKRQKDAKDSGLLNLKQINLLDDLKITWHKKSTTKVTKQMRAPSKISTSPVVERKIQQRWLDKYNVSKKYYETNGTLDGISSYIDKETGIKIGSWISVQRSRYSELSSSQRKLLDEINILGKTLPKTKEPILKENEEIEVLDLYPDAKEPVIQEEPSPREELISSIIPNLEDVNIDTLYKIKDLITKSSKEEDLNSELNQLYEGLLLMNDDELNKFSIMLESEPLANRKK